MVADDGRIRLVCCGKFVTGIGNVATDLTEEQLVEQAKRGKRKKERNA